MPHIHSLCYLKFKLELLLELKLLLESKLELEFAFPWRVANTELLAVEVDDAYYMR